MAGAPGNCPGTPPARAASAEMVEGIMGSLLFWTKAALIPSGPFVILAGLAWHETAKVLQAFDIDPGPERGLWVGLGGLGMTAVGLGLHYFGI